MKAKSRDVKKRKLIMICVQFSVYYAVSFSIHYTGDKTKVQPSLSQTIKRH